MVENRTGEGGLKPLSRGMTPTGTDEAAAAEARIIIRKAAELKRRRRDRMRRGLRIDGGRSGRKGGMR